MCVKLQKFGNPYALLLGFATLHISNIICPRNFRSLCSVFCMILIFLTKCVVEKHKAKCTITVLQNMWDWVYRVNRVYGFDKCKGLIYI